MGQHAQVLVERRDERGVSELIGTVLLVGLVITAMAIVAVVVLSSPPPEQLPHVNAVAENQSNIIYLIHTGGDALDREKIRIVVNGIESHFEIDDNSANEWTPGKRLMVDYGGPGMPEYLQLIYRGNTAEALILTEYFVPMNQYQNRPDVCPTVTADFTATPASGYAPLSVSFTDHSTSGVPITSWSWSFGDGSTSTLQNPTHIYTTLGSYTVSLTATNSCGKSETTYQTITVISPCPAVTANFTANTTSGYAPLSVSFTDNSTSGIPIISWSWSFGDGSTSTLQNPTHIYTTPGNYTVSLTATNSCGKSETTYQTITVISPCPVVTADFTANTTSGYAPLSVSFTDNSTSSVPIISWSWSFGDGSTSLLQNPTHTYTTPGNYTVSLNATNSCGNSATTIKSDFIKVQVVPSTCGKISGTKYNDLNGNGKRDAGEPGLADWTIEVYRKSGNDWIFVTSVTTGADGIYTVSGLQYHPEEKYLVKEIVKPGWTRTQPVNENYYDSVQLNQPHCYETGIDFGNHQVPDTILNTKRAGYVRDGGQLKFRVTGTYSKITIGGVLYDLNPGDVISLTINGDSSNVEIDMNGNSISRFSFPDVSVTRNGASLKRGAINDIWISQYTDMTSTLSIVVPSTQSPVWIQLIYAGNTIINGDNKQRITLGNLYPRSSDGFMRLDVEGNNVYYSGGATGYQLA